MTGELVLRRAGEADLPGILDLARASLDWDDDDRHDAFFTWKHLENPVGPSPMWVAGRRRVDRRLPHVPAVGVVPSRRLHCQRRSGGRHRDHPDHQGRGLFTALTMGALDELTAEGVDFVFNTPNDQSRPGYLKMGWQVIGRPPVRVRPRGLRGLRRLARARVPAEKWSEPAAFGHPASEVFAGGELVGVTDTLATDTLTTNRTPAYFRWRYGFAPLHYRVVHRGDTLADGFAVVRLRRRGAAIEATVCELVVPGGDRRAVGDLLGQIEGADYVLVAGRFSPRDGGLLPLPHQGPQVTWRSLTEPEAPTLSGWTLSLGDLELF